jgi:uncharacterized protein DUF1918
VAKKGDLIVVNAARVGGPPREGEILEVIEGELRVQYRVHWNDGHESLFAPAPGSARIEPARDPKRTGRSQVTKPRKTAEKATTKKRSAAKATAAKRPSRKK